MADLADMAGKELAPPEENPRRNFLVAAMAVVIGGIVAIFPFVAGFGVLLDPLRRKSARAESAIARARVGLPRRHSSRAHPISCSSSRPVHWPSGRSRRITL